MKTITVKKFIEKLQKLPEDLELFLATKYEDGTKITEFDSNPQVKVFTVKNGRTFSGTDDIIPNNSFEKGTKKRKAAIIY